MKSLYEEAKKTMIKSRNVLVISHKKPDADTLGAAIALKIWLNKIGKSVTLACVDRPAPIFNFLPCLDEFVNDFELKDFDLMIVVDAGAHYMTGFHIKYPDLFNTGIPVINIDHHASNDMYGTVNIVENEAASATVILYGMLKDFGVASQKWGLFFEICFEIFAKFNPIIDLKIKSQSIEWFGNLKRRFSI